MQIPSSPLGSPPAASGARSAAAHSSAGQNVQLTSAPASEATQPRPGMHITSFICKPAFARDTLHALISAQVDQTRQDDLGKDLMAQADTNKDGKLGLDELGAAVSDTSDHLPARLSAAARALKAKLDADGAAGDPPLTQDQLDASLRALDLPRDDTPMSSDEIDAAVHALDSDGDNALSDGEIRTALDGVGKDVRPMGISADFVARTLETLDATGEDTLSLGKIRSDLALNLRDHTSDTA
jgi:hypothetical protein